MTIRHTHAQGCRPRGNSLGGARQSRRPLERHRVLLRRREAAPLRPARKRETARGKGPRSRLHTRLCASSGSTTIGGPFSLAGAGRVAAHRVPAHRVNRYAAVTLRACPAESIVIFADDPLDGLASRVSMALGIAFHAPRASSHYGEPYYSAWPESELKLTDNLDPMYRPGDPPDDRYFIPELKDAQFILWNADPVDQSVAAASGSRDRCESDFLGDARRCPGRRKLRTAPGTAPDRVFSPTSHASPRGDLAQPG